MQRTYELWRDETPRTMAWYATNNQYYAHFHSTIELIYVESGVLCAVQNGVSHLVSANHLIANSSYIVHSYSTPKRSHIIIVTIPLSTVPSLRARLEQNSFAQGVADMRGCKECHRILCMMASPKLAQNAQFVDSLGEALLSLLIDKIGLKQNVSDAESDLIKRILAYLREHASEVMSVERAAAHFGYSAGRFSHIFNEKVGCSLPRYLNSLRCQMAERMLRQSGAPLSEIAESCGFASLRTFHRVYLEYAGQTPRRGAESGALGARHAPSDVLELP